MAAEFDTRSIEDVLSYYGAEVVPALATALFHDDEFPDEILNEIRAAFTHLSRANSLQAGFDRQAEIDAALRHLKRTVLDCLKDAIALMARDTETLIATLSRDMRLPASNYRRTGEIREKREALSISEGQRPTTHAIESYKKLYADILDLHKTLIKEYEGTSAEERLRVRRRNFYAGIAIAFVVGMATSILGGLFLNHLG